MLTFVSMTPSENSNGVTLTKVRVPLSSPALRQLLIPANSGELTSDQTFNKRDKAATKASGIDSPIEVAFAEAEESSKGHPGMSMKDYEAARAILRRQDLVFKVDPALPAPPHLIEMAEQTLGVTFPETYRRFLNDFGTTAISGFEVYGIIREDFANSGIHDGIWSTLRSREDMELGPSYVLVKSGGDGTYVAIDTSCRDADGECPLVRV